MSRRLPAGLILVQQTFVNHLCMQSGGTGDRDTISAFFLLQNYFNFEIEDILEGRKMRKKPQYIGKLLFCKLFKFLPVHQSSR